MKYTMEEIQEILPKLLAVAEAAKSFSFHHVSCPRTLGYIQCNCGKQALDRALAALEQE